MLDSVDEMVEVSVVALEVLGVCTDVVELRERLEVLEAFVLDLLVLGTLGEVMEKEVEAVEVLGLCTEVVEL